jgi:hypothetical protein
VLAVLVLVLLPVLAQAESGSVDPQTPVRGELVMLTTALIVVTSIEATSIVIPFGTVGFGRRHGILLTHQRPHKPIPLDRSFH